LGALLGLFCTLAIAQFFGELAGISEWVLASLGASALLVFVLPSSPMAQPWAVVGGNTLSALIGIACNYLFSNPLIALPIAASSAIMGMFLLRCLHPPAAAVALIAVLGHVTHFRYAFFPVMVDSLALCMVAMIYNTFTGKVYPTRPQALKETGPLQEQERIQAEQRLDKLLNEYQEVMDVDRAELIKIIQDVSK
jgi:CBS domain-containing membrane protein